MTPPAADPLTAGDFEAAEAVFRRRILAALGLSGTVLMALIGVSLLLYQRSLAYSAWVEHTYAAESRIHALATEFEKLETARRGYLIDRRDEYWRTYVDTRGRLRPMLADLGEFTADNPVQTRLLARLAPLVEAKLDQMRATIELAHDGDPERARANFLAGQDQYVQVRMRAAAAAMIAEEDRLLTRRTNVTAQNDGWLVAMAVGVALLLGLIAAGVAVLVRRYSGELNRSRHALRALNAGLEGAVRERTADLQRANDEIQRFAYIVSHDLRSPLVNVMGFTSELEAAMKPVERLLERAEAADPELAPGEVRLAVREDIPESIGFIRSSTRKMDRLINAILTLSRQGRRTLNPEPLDLAAVARAVSDSLETLARDKGAEVVTEAPLPALVSDRLAVEQILSNLVENALKYLQPGRPGRVVLRAAATAAGRVRLEVEDNGRGIDPRDHERVFELFRRSGAQTTPGEGIGLAHVRALVYRLGGGITCRSELGRGSVFTVDLPARLEREEGAPAA